MINYKSVLALLLVTNITKLHEDHYSKQDIEKMISEKQITYNSTVRIQSTQHPLV